MATTMRWQPFMNLWNELEPLWRRTALAENFGRGLAASYPLVNVWQDENHIYVEAELPGMKLENVEMYVTGGNQLTIQGERAVEAPEQGVWHRQERGFGKFQRTLELPLPVNADKVEARLDSGVLIVTLPKAESAKPRRIQVKAE